MAYGDFDYLPRRTIAYKKLYDKTLKIQKIEIWCISMRAYSNSLWIFYWKKLHKPIIKKLEKHSLFVDNIWGVCLADMQLLSKFDKEICCLLCVIDIFNKYTWVVPLRDKKGIIICDTFHKVWNKSGRNPNKIWVDRGSKF